MFKKKPTMEAATSSATPAKRRKINWLKVSVLANIAILVVIVFFIAGAEVIHKSDTDPNFCATCHIMESHVDSYLNGTNLDNLHAQAGVECKDCHDYPISAEIKGGIKFVTGDYTRDENGELPKREFGDEMCNQCHISQPYMERQTDFLYYNPHFTVMGIFTCTTCHFSHGEQVNFCKNCHPNPEQRMYGDTTPRLHQLGENYHYNPSQMGF